MDKYHDIHLWLDGEFVHAPNLMYKGGRLHHFNKINLDYFSEFELHELYDKAGGKWLNREFYWLYPGKSFQTGLRSIGHTWDIIDMQNAHYNVDEITIYAKQIEDPIQAIDAEGNEIPTKVDDSHESTKYLLAGVNLSDDEDVAVGGQSEPMVTQEEPVITQDEHVSTHEEVVSTQHKNVTMQDESINTPSDPVITQDESIITPTEHVITEEEPVITQNEPGVTQEESVFTKEESVRAQEENVNSPNEQCTQGDHFEGDYGFTQDDNITQDPDESPDQEKGKRKMPLHEDPDESPDDSDPDYSESDTEDLESSDGQSDIPSDALEDVEGSSEDDIFKERDRSKLAQRRKLDKILRKNRDVASSSKRIEVEDLPQEEWCSDADSDTNFDEPLQSDEQSVRHPIFKRGDDIKKLNLRVSLEFESVDFYKEVLTDWSVRQGFELHFLKCEKSRVTAECAAADCNWRIHASVKQRSTVFQIKTIKGVHSCARKSENFRARSSYLAKRMEEVIRDNPSIEIRKLQRKILRKCGVNVSYPKVLRAKRIAIEKLRGDDDKEYSMLWNYCTTVRQFNPGSKLLLKKKEGSDPPIFEKMYFCLAAMKKGFLAGCRPVIGLDGCFLKTLHGGQLLCAVGRDANDNLFPIAIALVPTESRATWTWFVSELLDDIGGVDENMWTFVSDRQKGLMECLKELAPDCEHRYCIRHLYQNFLGKWRTDELKVLFWRAASTANKLEFDDIMKQIENFDPKLNQNMETAADWLKKIPPIHWARSYFKTDSKCDILVNNLCESFNNMILPARDLPIISMFEWIRTRLMTRIQIKKEGMEKYQGTICPNILKKINKQQENARRCVPMWCGYHELEVECGDDKFIVKLDEKTCSCGMWQLCGYPCNHACSAIGQMRLKMEDFVHSWYKKETYLKSYAHIIHAVPGKRHYIQTESVPLAPPAFKRKMGRPKKLRRKGPDEFQRVSTRKGLTTTCSKCLRLGHNKKTCTNHPHPNSKHYKGTTAHQKTSQSTHAATPQMNARSEHNRSETVAPQHSQDASTQTGGNKQDPRVHYEGRRNADLLGTVNDTSWPAASTPTDLPTGSAHQPRMSTTTTTTAAPSSQTAPSVQGQASGVEAPRKQRFKRPTVEEVLRKVQERAAKRRVSKP